MLPRGLWTLTKPHTRPFKLNSIMARATKSSNVPDTWSSLRRSTRNYGKKPAESPTVNKEEPVETCSSTPPPATSGRQSRKRAIKAGTPAEEDTKRPSKRVKKSSPTTPAKVKSEPESPNASPSSKRASATKTTAGKAADLQAKKLKSYGQFADGPVKKSPFPDFAHPTPEECQLAHRILASLHGDRRRPEKVAAAPTGRAGCGDSPSVLDALVRTILSQNTSDKNSTRAKLSMDDEYGGSDRWEAIVAGGRERLQRTIQSGGLSQVKSKVILEILRQTKERYGEYSLDHLFEASDDDAMKEMISFQGVGPKTASCVLLFCLRRESFAVDTHVHRITGLLGWRPKDCSREETHAHLDARIPDEDKYGLHVLLVGHGKKCDECKAGGKSLGKCELRKAFRQGKVEGKAGKEVKEEEIKHIKKEEDEGRGDSGIDVDTKEGISHAVE